MKFYGSGIVWDKVKNKPLAKFNEGVIDTQDPELIEKLLELHYKNNGKFPTVMAVSEIIEIPETVINIQAMSDPEPILIEGLKPAPPKRRTRKATK